MGGWVSRWSAKPTTVEVLEGLDKNINTLEEHREKTQKQLKLWVYRLLLYSTLLYFMACIIVYSWYIPEQLIGKLIVTSPFLISPPLIWVLRKLLIALHAKRTEKNDEKLEELKSEKKRILEQVMETETYKNAKLILERFDPDSKKKIELEATPVRPSMISRQGQELRQRLVTPRTPVVLTPNPAAARPPAASAAPPALISAPGGPPERSLSASAQHQNLLRRSATPIGTLVPGMDKTFGSLPMHTAMKPVLNNAGIIFCQHIKGMHPPGPPLARPVLPRERGALDKVIEYLVGDGPQNRYALVCQQCLSHNGMALKEEFEYIAFRCAYCYFLNPARKTRPQAPHLPEFGETKMSLGPSATATETDHDVTASLPDKSETVDPGEVSEPKDEHKSEVQSEEKNVGVPESEDVVDKSNNELEVSAMEVE